MLIGDIGNEYYDELHCDEETAAQDCKNAGIPRAKQGSCRIALRKLFRLDDRIAVTGHAPYSTAPELLLAIKQRCNRFQQFSPYIPVRVQTNANSSKQVQDLFVIFWKRKTAGTGFPFSESGFSGTIEYFDHLGILDDKTLLVHCVHVSED